MDDQPSKPLERAVWWTEHVLRHGGAQHLRAPAANISWAQYLELKLIATFIVIFIVLLFIFLGIIRVLLSLLRKLIWGKQKKD